MGLQQPGLRAAGQITELMVEDTWHQWLGCSENRSILLEGFEHRKFLGASHLQGTWLESEDLVELMILGGSGNASSQTPEELLFLNILVSYRASAY